MIGPTELLSGQVCEQQSLACGGKRWGELWCHIEHPLPLATEVKYVRIIQYSSLSVLLLKHRVPVFVNGNPLGHLVVLVVA